MRIVIFLLLVLMSACGTVEEPPEPEPSTPCVDGTYEGRRACEVNGLVCFEGWCRYPCNPDIVGSCAEYAPHFCEERFKDGEFEARHFCELPEGV